MIAAQLQDVRICEGDQFLLFLRKVQNFFNSIKIAHGDLLKDFHVLRSFDILPAWFISPRLQNLNFQPLNI